MKCGDSLEVEQSLFQTAGGGAIPTSPLQCRVEECSFSQIRGIFEKYHYKGGHIGGGISFCLSLVYGANIVGGCVVGKPRHEKKYKDCIEIRRMALLDECPKNSESYFLSKVVLFVKNKKIARTIISYSDQTVGHKGTIYKAANFQLLGQTAPTLHVIWNGVRYHPRSLTIDRPYSYRLREAVKNGEARIEKGLPKLIFAYNLR